MEEWGKEEHGRQQKRDVPNVEGQEPQSRKHENWKTRKGARGFMKLSSFVLSSFRVFVMGFAFEFLCSDSTFALRLRAERWRLIETDYGQRIIGNLQQATGYSRPVF